MAYESVKFTGINYISEEQFSRVLKSRYDLIQKKWSFRPDNTIELEAYSFEKNATEQLYNFENSTPAASSFFNEAKVQYINWGLPVGFALYGAVFWDWGQVHNFRTRDEGWFARDTYAGGADKLSHAYYSFLVDRISYNLYRTNGLSHQSALKYSFIMATVIGLLIETGDAFSNFGFSIGDFISDIVGAGLGHLLNSNAYLDELIGFQFWWLDESALDQKKTANIFRQVSDYNRQKYILNFRFAAIPALREFKLTRYINLDLGYYTRGYKSTVPSPEGPARTLYTGVSLNLTQLLRDLFPKSDYAYYTSSFFKYYQAPYTAVEVVKK